MSQSSQEDVLRVSIGACIDHNGKILVAKRPPNTHLGGMWELPGGKLEAGESPPDALHRELHEEVGIRIRDFRSLSRSIVKYEEKTIEINSFEVLTWSGAPRSAESQEIGWATYAELRSLPLPMGTLNTVYRLRFPRVIAYSPPHTDSGFALRDWAQDILTRIKAANLHHKRYKDRLALVVRCNSAWASFARDVRELQTSLSAEEVEVILHSRHEPQNPRNRELNSDESSQMRPFSVHYSNRDWRKLSQTASTLRESASSNALIWPLIGVSCHDFAEMKNATEGGADYLTVSPVAATESHPLREALGWQCFSKLAQSVDIPVYALGGMKLDDLETAIENSAFGVAFIRG